MGHKTINNIKTGAVCLILIALIAIISGCGKTLKPERPSMEEIEKGSNGLIIEFLEGAPPEEVLENAVLQSGIRLSNQGTNEVKRGYLLLGYEKEYISLYSWQGGGANDKITISLKGKSLTLPEGEEGVYLANMEVKDIGPQREKADTTIYATTCYDYQTKAHATMCIDTDVYNLKQTEKACSASDMSLTDQGAPVAVKRIESRMIVSKEGDIVKPQFIIHFGNVGDGTITAAGRADIACSAQPLSKDDINTIKVSAVLSESVLSCKPEILKLRENSDYTTCTLELGIDQSIPGYYAPLTITADYGYMETISKQVSIRKTNV